MKCWISISSLILMLGCNTQMKETTNDRNYSFFVGTYTDGESQGIYTYSLNENGNFTRIGLAVKSENPSFLAISPDNEYLVAVNEIDEGGQGAVESFKIISDSLSRLSHSQSGGAHPCFVAINENGYVVTANYSGGNIGLLKMNKHGVLSALLDTEQHSGSGATDRQEAPHAHSAWFVPQSQQVISVDLGTNELWFSILDTIQQKLIPSNPQKLRMNPGAGPRHLAFHTNNKWIYVLNELDCTVTIVYVSIEGLYEKGPSVSTLPAAHTEPNTAADIHITSDGKFVYASNRGYNSLAIYKADAIDGSLTLLGHQTTHGEWPRNFSLSPDEKYIVVANQYSNNLVSFKRDMTTGLLTYVDQVEAPTPVSIVFKSSD